MWIEIGNDTAFRGYQVNFETMQSEEAWNVVYVLHYKEDSWFVTHDAADKVGYADELNNPWQDLVNQAYVNYIAEKVLLCESR